MTKINARSGVNKEMDIELVIKPEAYQKMMALTSACSSEVGGLIVCDIKLPKIVVEDILVPEQEATGGDWEADANKMADLLTPFIKTNPEIWEKTKGWWHSHVNGGVFWSMVDENNIDSLLPVSKVLVSIVTNKSMQMKVRVDLVLPNGMFLSIDDIEPNISLFNEKIEKWTEKQLKKVTERKVVWQKSWGKKIDIDNDEVFWGYDNKQHIPDNGLHHPQFGFIPSKFNDLNVENQQVFLREIKRKENRNMTNKQRNMWIKDMIASQDDQEDVPKIRSKDYDDGVDYNQIPYGGG